MSAIGTKRTSLVAPHMSAIGGKADMPFFYCICPLMTQNGHAARADECPLGGKGDIGYVPALASSVGRQSAG